MERKSNIVIKLVPFKNKQSSQIRILELAISLGGLSRSTQLLDRPYRIQVNILQGRFSMAVLDWGTAKHHNERSQSQPERPRRNPAPNLIAFFARSPGQYRSTQIRLSRSLNNMSKNQGIVVYYLSLQTGLALGKEMLDFLKIILSPRKYPYSFRAGCG